MTRTAKAVSGLLTHRGLVPRLLAGAAMALAARAGAAPLWAWMASRQALHADGSGDMPLFCAALWFLACMIASFAACPLVGGAEARRRVTGDAPLKYLTGSWITRAG
jgi:hypothetical protein